MRKLLGNSCVKGCLVYFIALLAILAVAAFGVGGLTAHFSGGNTTIQGTSVSPSPLSVLPSFSNNSTSSASAAQPGAANNPSDVLGGGYFPPTTLPDTPVPTTPAVNASGDSGSSPQVFTPVQSQGGVISGHATEPFYIVQPGDTLWSISQKFEVDTDALSSVNNLTGDTIYAGQILYLPPNKTVPQSNQPQPGTASAQGNAPSTPASVGDLLPGMPDTGVNRKK